MKAPNFIVLGAHKAGTTSLHHYLKQHPEIFLLPQKGTDLLAKRKVVTLDDAGEYLAQFEGASETQILGEVSSVYLHADGVAEKIKRLFPQTQLIAVLRNPIERAISAFFWEDSFKKEEIRNFEKTLLASERILKNGLYGQHIENYFCHFERQQIKLILFECFKEDKPKFFSEIYNFIGVANKVFTPKTDKVYNLGEIVVDNTSRKILKAGFEINQTVKFFVPKFARSFIREFLRSKSVAPKPKISNELKAKLRDYYHDDIILLEKITGLDCHHWLEI